MQMTFTRLVLLALLTSMAHLAVAQTLDYETYKKTVEPIFTKKRGHILRALTEPN